MGVMDGISIVVECVVEGIEIGRGIQSSLLIGELVVEEFSCWKGKIVSTNET